MPHLNYQRSILNRMTILTWNPLHPKLKQHALFLMDRMTLRNQNIYLKSIRLRSESWLVRNAIKNSRKFMLKPKDCPLRSTILKSWQLLRKLVAKCSCSRRITELLNKNYLIRLRIIRTLVMHTQRICWNTSYLLRFLVVQQSTPLITKKPKCTRKIVRLLLCKTLDMLMKLRTSTFSMLQLSTELQRLWR